MKRTFLQRWQFPTIALIVLLVGVTVVVWTLGGKGPSRSDSTHREVSFTGNLIDRSCESSNSRTTVAQLKCARNESDQSNALLDRTLLQIEKSKGTHEVNQLEVLWSRYRDAACRLESSKFSSYSNRTLSTLHCQTRLTLIQANQVAFLLSSDAGFNL